MLDDAYLLFIIRKVDIDIKEIVTACWVPESYFYIDGRLRGLHRFLSNGIIK